MLLKRVGLALWVGECQKSPFSLLNGETIFLIHANLSFR